MSNRFKRYTENQTKGDGFMSSYLICSRPLCSYLLVKSILLLLILPGNASAALKQKASVYISVKCLDQSNGAPVYLSASGVIVSKRGHILTAGHPFDCKVDDLKLDYQSVTVAIGNSRGQKRPVNLISKQSSDNIDIAVLRLVDPPSNMPFAQICRLTTINPGKEILTYGFPEGQNYTPVGGTAGSVTDDEMWGVVAPFYLGMSGGAVTSKDLDIVVGLIKGGVPGNPTKSKVFPLYRSISLIEQAGIDSVENCDTYLSEEIYSEETDFSINTEQGYPSDEARVAQEIYVAGAARRPPDYFKGENIALSLGSDNRTIIRENSSCESLTWVVERDETTVLE